MEMSKKLFSFIYSIFKSNQYRNYKLKYSIFAANNCIVRNDLNSIRFDDVVFTKNHASFKKGEQYKTLWITFDFIKNQTLIQCYHNDNFRNHYGIVPNKKIVLNCTF